MFVTLKDFTWNSEDLEQCKQALFQISDKYGDGVVMELESRGYFGNLNVEAALEELYM